MTKVTTSIRMVWATLVFGGHLWCLVEVWIYCTLWWCLSRRSTMEPLDQAMRVRNTASEMDHRRTVAALGLDEQNHFP